VAHVIAFRRRYGGRLGMAAVAALYLLLTTYQLGLPGLHYDEAREAGLNAMELLTGAPASLFRHTGLTGFGRTWPLMVQDYIGALNVYLALPLLWLTGIGVPNLRVVAVLTGLVALLLVERTVTEWIALVEERASAVRLPISGAGLLAVVLLAASPSFVFWSRQGIFVTNLTQPLVLALLWQGVRWLRVGRGRHLLWAALWAGCALYAKLLAVWVVAPFGLLAAGWWLWRLWTKRARPPLSWSLFWGALLLLLLPLTPLFWFNWQSGGTLAAIGGNLGTSYYGVDNLAVGANLQVRLTQAWQMLVGNHLWYLGGVYGNQLAGWATTFLLALSLCLGIFSAHYRGRLLPPLLLLVLSFGASLFTLSDLFVTHYALLQPLAVAVAALALCTPLPWPQPTARQLLNGGRVFLVLLWLLGDLTATVRYHQALSTSGGLADHSDATYHLAYYLQYNGLGAPLALDWGFDAPVRYLSQGAVTPIEIFGYASPQQPDAAFGARLQPFLANPANVYLLHAPHATVFAGRREQFLALAAEGEAQAELITSFAQRDGTPLFELWRVH
jgi:hypothetical protein